MVARQSLFITQIYFIVRIQKRKGGREGGRKNTLFFFFLFLVFQVLTQNRKAGRSSVTFQNSNLFYSTNPKRKRREREKAEALMGFFIFSLPSSDTKP